jgi:hypothetical protein
MFPTVSSQSEGNGGRDCIGDLETNFQLPEILWAGDRQAKRIGLSRPKIGGSRKKAVARR